jgi:hypothetical protein
MAFKIKMLGILDGEVHPKIQVIWNSSKDPNLFVVDLL